jgi:site-specific DNA recombinase
MNEEEQRKLMETLIEEIQIYEERQTSGQWLKSITFRLPIIDSDMSIPIGNSLDSETHIEVVCQLSNHRKRPDSYVKLEVDAEDYYRIKDGE